MSSINTLQQLLFLIVTAILFVLCSYTTSAVAQDKYKPGDRVECEVTGTGKYWEKGTILPFRDNDQPDGSWYRVKVDANGGEYYCKLEFLRASAGPPTTPSTTATPTAPAGRTQPEKTGAPLADRASISCPVQQVQVRNGARPHAELFAKIIRCKKGERPAENGAEGAVVVEVASVQIGASRPWSYSEDSGNAQPGTIVYPVKATYTVKTFYRTATEVEENWVRILNFYVNPFGEWQIGSEEPVQSPTVRRILKGS